MALGSDFDGALIPREIGDAAGLPALVGAMRQAGYGEALIDEDLLGELGRRAGADHRLGRSMRSFQAAQQWATVSS